MKPELIKAASDTIDQIYWRENIQILFDYFYGEGFDHDYSEKREMQIATQIAGKVMKLAYEELLNAHVAQR